MLALGAHFIFAFPSSCCRGASCNHLFPPHPNLSSIGGLAVCWGGGHTHIQQCPLVALGSAWGADATLGGAWVGGGFLLEAWSAAVVPSGR